MYRSIESVLLAEFLIDALALWAVLYPDSRIRTGRLVFAAAFGALSTCLAAIMEIPASRTPMLALMVSPVLITITSGWCKARKLIALSVTLALTCGFIELFIRLAGGSYWLILIAILIASVCSAKAYIYRRDRMETWDTDVTIAKNGKVIRVRALIDTGNRLHEPVSSLPVMIVEQRAISRIIPETFDPDAPVDTLPKGWRLAAYGALGSCGSLGCFMPDKLFTENGHTASNIWIAVFPGELPGEHNALAPPALIHTMQTKWRML